MMRTNINNSFKDFLLAILDKLTKRRRFILPWGDFLKDF